MKTKSQLGFPPWKKKTKSQKSPLKRMKNSQAHTYVVSIDNRLFINVTVSDADVVVDSKIREWVHGIQAIYGKKNRRNLIVGLSALSSRPFANGSNSKGT
ncbi:hypothetical protein V6N13_047927 [Hibiscus sabdariffa]|uniref:Uncharacterized protein n=1 Tax=Hibiscus sabdariffa TaxID=183260 RepID=A0ABR2F5N5_9ROSI